MHFENLKPHNPSTKDWCIPNDMDEGDYLMIDPACEVDETAVGNEKFEVDEQNLPYAEEDWINPEQTEVPKNIESHLHFSMQTQQSDRARPAKKNNYYRDDFVVDRKVLKNIVEDPVGLEGITVSQEVDIVD